MAIIGPGFLGVRPRFRQCLISYGLNQLLFRHCLIFSALHILSKPTTNNNTTLPMPCTYSVVALDSSFRPLRRCLLWCDARSAPQCKHILEVRLSCYQNTISCYQNTISDSITISHPHHYQLPLTFPHSLSLTRPLSLSLTLTRPLSLSPSLLLSLSPSGSINRSLLSNR